MDNVFKLEVWIDFGEVINSVDFIHGLQKKYKYNHLIKKLKVIDISKKNGVMQLYLTAETNIIVVKYDLENLITIIHENIGNVKQVRAKLEHIEVGKYMTQCQLIEVAKYFTNFSDPYDVELMYGALQIQSKMGLEIGSLSEIIPTINKNTSPLL
jgi:hypothetical protein